ncbi:MULTISPECIES: branched-chain amino acid ABC transporter permease [Caldilinea]|uniref:Putative branched-chain amino acid ABC transporter permease protein n=1 Tax=Caldilinea aerophila (strain DSM 14535 / JCM 11387 / NBRC 104270 / STL-6-O1) TaxID=926550 RepID=I0I6F9_CALAS|nr:MULTISPECIES: branched-chain amino acid ABC transporter permease [Caldilinea]MBO9392971.1 branched-chain amino acid ABC transporter permease [Caldilinea sp.]BAM00847.1 putative branched-chain amino acid ABC transporter permease protein [Caldilinea aerophila DSM 14535 = NBRC 104270]GIV72187.1 MAG: branched-chain amino acid ABC transporter permease [Caldilinea sp.]
MFTPTYIAQQIINGVNLGSMYALIAIGLTMVYGLLRLINFAHGDLLMLGAYLGLLLVSATITPLILTLFIPMLAIGFVGILVERLAYRPLRGAPEVTMLITSLAVSSIIENSMVMTVTAQPRAFNLPAGVNQLHTVAGVSFSTLDALTVGLSVALMAALTLYVRNTRTGIAMRAAAENLRAARLMGIDINRVVMVAFFLGSMLAAAAGWLWAAKYSTVEPFMGFLPGLKAFVAAVIGGIGVIPGAVLGGYLLGFAEIFFVGFLPPAFSGYRDAFVFALLLLILLIRPNGILGTSTEERA